MRYELTALSPIWTGGIGKNDGTRITRLTGLKGSIRWWCEALVRGLGGHACDPTTDECCKLDNKKLDGKRDIRLQLDEQEICPVCQLFGCTGWSGKFLLRIEKANNEQNQSCLIKIECEDDFTLRLIPRKNLEPYEKRLLNMTIKLIVEYGALGGRLTLKPSEKGYKNFPDYDKKNHLDYGILKFRKDPDIQTVPLPEFNNASKNKSDWPDLKYFWFVKGSFINRKEHNSIVDRDNNNGKYKTQDERKVFLGGYNKEELKKVTGRNQRLQNEISNRGPIKSDSESKKIFSFHGIGGRIDEINFSPRCFGYARNEGEREIVTKIIKDILNNKGDTYSFYTGQEVIDAL